MWRPRKRALAAVPRPKAAAAFMTAGTDVAREAATAGAIGLRTSEFDPMTATEPVRRYATGGMRARVATGWAIRLDRCILAFGIWAKYPDHIRQQRE
jgi:hypothetical protein